MEFEKIRAIIVNVLAVSEDEVTEETRFMDDLGADSLDIYQIVVEMEDEFGVEISDEIVEKVETVGDALDMIKNALQN